MGWVDNAQGLLRAGQFVSAKVALPPPGNEVAIPATALIERGGEKLVFVQQDVDPVFVLRRVSLSRLVGDQACVHMTPPGGADALGLQPGELVVTSGVVELQQSLTELQASQAGAPPSGQATP
jgi:cobalt-zinc-cadmium efflux system membrane fusion protein